MPDGMGDRGGTRNFFEAIAEIAYSGLPPVWDAMATLFSMTAATQPSIEDVQSG